MNEEYSMDPVVQDDGNMGIRRSHAKVASARGRKEYSHQPLLSVGKIDSEGMSGQECLDQRPWRAGWSGPWFAGKGYAENAWVVCCYRDTGWTATPINLYPGMKKIPLLMENENKGIFGFTGCCPSDGSS
jgi:hypothetical protein